MADLILTKKQNEVFELLKSDANRIMLYGGSRSGKTFAIVLLFVLGAIWHKGSRQAILRHHRTDARQSLWMDTIKKVLKILQKREGIDYTKNESDMVINFSNGSEIWVGGLDDKDRVEKILGNEYARMYFNESSQISYDTITTAITRLAQKVKDMRLLALFDMNPPSPLHWTYKMFIEKVDPETQKPLVRPEKYTYMKINPVDNVENLPHEYIEDVLDLLPEKKRKRFKDGEFVKEEGTIYDNFDPEKNVITKDKLPPMEYWSKGTDFGLNMASVLIGWCGDNIYIVDCYGAYNITTRRFQAILKAKGWDQHWGYNYCDPSGGERLQEVYMSQKADNDVEAGIDNIQTAIEEDRFFVVNTCRGVLDEIMQYKKDDNGKIVKVNDHFMDAMRYGIHSFRKPVKFKRTHQTNKTKPITSGYRDKTF